MGFQQSLPFNYYKKNFFWSKTLIFLCFTEKKNRVNSLDSVSISNKISETVRLPPSVPPKQVLDTNNEEISPSWRKQNTRQTKADLPSPVKATGKNSF